jgi:hypothetical protein
MELLSRRQVLIRGAAAAGGLAGFSLLEPAVALARGHGNPNPIPGGFDDSFSPVPSNPFIHVLSPGLGPQLEMATITDFTGVIGASEIRGTAHGSDGTTWDFDTDMRFMQGAYVDRNGRVQKGSFGFV